MSVHQNADFDWSTYESLRQASEQNRVFLSYDRGELEIMSPSPHHEWYAFELGQFVVTISREMGLPIRPGQMMTLRRPDLVRGIEADQCFWIAHEREMRTKMQIDFTVDPPPDLFIEVEISRSLVDRLAICAALGIPEVWRFDGTALTVLELGDDQTYRERSHSRWFPAIDLPGMLPFLEPSDDRDYHQRSEAFREWVVGQLHGA